MLRGPRSYLILVPKLFTCLRPTTLLSLNFPTYVNLYFTQLCNITLYLAADSLGPGPPVNYYRPLVNTELEQYLYIYSSSG